MGREGIESSVPVHNVHVPTFKILQTEVTVAQYAICVQAGACGEPSDTSMTCKPNTDGDNYKTNWNRRASEMSMPPNFCRQR